MKKLTNGFKLTVLGAAVASLGVGCASSGYARYDADRTDSGMGAAAHAEVGREYHTTLHSDNPAANATVSALGRSVDTRANWLNKFPFYDHRLMTIETYTFVPDGDRYVRADINDRAFDTDLPEGSVYVEAAGGTSAGVIRHTPNPSR